MNLTLEKADKLMHLNDGNLDLSNTPITALPEGLTVGGGLDLSGTQIKDRKCKKLTDGDYVPGRYIYADGMLMHCRAKKRVRGYDLYIGKIKGQNLVSDGTHYAHCKTLREGIADLNFKAAKDRGAEQYRSLTIDSRVSAQDAITMYRIITGACRAGTEQFVGSLGKLKESYTVREIMEITDGQYNSDAFKKFFTEESL